MDPETQSKGNRNPLREDRFTVVPVPYPSLVNTEKQCGEVAGVLAGRWVFSAAS